jgi:hypothetical protein
MKSSINFQPVKNTSQSHNLRLREFDYVRKDLKDENYSSGSTVKHSEIIKELKALVKEKTGRTAQEKAVFIKEGVFLIKPEHTNEQLQKFAENFALKFNVKLLELHIHRDEGHWEDSENKKGWKPNLHAHMVVENINRNTGKSVAWKRDDMVKMQDFFAENLEMERGLKSDKKHIDSKTWKIQKMESEINGKKSYLSDLNDKAVEFIDQAEDCLTEAKNMTNDSYTRLLDMMLSQLAKKTQTTEQINAFVKSHEHYKLLIKSHTLRKNIQETSKTIQTEKEEIKNKSKGMRR